MGLIRHLWQVLDIDLKEARGAVLEGFESEAPSHVVQLRDPSAHAEREAIRDAQRCFGRVRLRLRLRLDGSVFYPRNSS